MMGLCWSIPVDVPSTILISITVFLILRWYMRRHIALPPGPRSLPVVGSLPTLLSLRNTGAPHQIFQRLSEKHGPVLMVNLVAGNRVVVLHGYDVIRDALNHPDLNGRPSLSVFEQVLQGGIGVVGASGELWRAQRKLTLNFMRDFGVGKPVFEDRITTEAGFMLDEIRTYNGRPFNPSQILSSGISNVICSVVFGSRYDYTDSIFIELQRAIYRNTELMGGATGAILFMPYSHLLASFLPMVKECLDNTRHVNDFSRSVLEEHRKTFNPEIIRDFMDVILEEERRAEDSTVTVNDLLGTTADLFSAGSETSSTTLRWALLYMIEFPEIQRKIQGEIDREVGRDCLPRLSDRAKLPYTEASLHEIQRISNIIPLGVPHEASSDVTFRGYNIPKGTIILPNLWALGMDQELWPEPDKFIPERFFDETDQSVKKSEKLIPYGTGRRACLGEQLAKMELFLFFTHFLHGFNLSKPEGAPPISFQGVGGISLSPLPFEICANRRK
ncbi:cytochrome P450 2J6-like [Asterias amurensis]|uniref:cytochrome P450 2J6-like n=1 Tax=Asterias amurensis TaxID=7602 RepID=UPI003AB1735A